MAVRGKIRQYRLFPLSQALLHACIPYQQLEILTEAVEVGNIDNHAILVVLTGNAVNMMFYSPASRNSDKSDNCLCICYEWYKNVYIIVYIYIVSVLFIIYQ